MSTRRSGGSPRRALSGVAILALSGAMFAPLSAAADDDTFVAPGSATPESKIQGDEITGIEFVPNKYFIELAGASTTAGGSVASIESSRERFLADAAAAGVDIEVQGEFSTLWNGLSVTADEGGLLDLASSDAVTAIFPVGIIEAPEQPETMIDPQLATAKSMTGADAVHSELGITGEGIRIGIIDTGIDTDHPDFGGTGTPGDTAFPSAKIVAGYDFVGDSYNADPGAGDAYQPKPMPDDNPDDCQGHGTHVAGIAAANGEVVGVAPDALLGAYRVFGCDGSTEGDVMLHAMEQSLADGMDVVNLSIGSSYSSWKEYPTARATDALAREGVIVTASIGNEGANGLHSAGAPGTGADTIGVGSVDNVEYMASVFLDEDGEPVPYAPAEGSPLPPTSGTATAVAVGAPGTPEGQGCTAYTPEQAAEIEGNWLLVQRGDCTFHTKALNGQEAGAAGVIIYNNAPGALNATVAGDPPITVPVVGIMQGDGERLVADALADGGTSITWTDEEASVPNPTGGLMSSFSSFGTMADTTFKPDVSAPGGSIYAPYPLEKGGYATLSGTSMAAPHAAGAAALMLEADPGLGVHEAKIKLQNSSEQVALNVAPTAGLEVVHRQGSGLIQIDDAILATTVLEPGLVQLGQQLSGETSTQTVSVTNTSEEELTYAISHEAAIATIGTATEYGYYIAPATVTHPETVTVPAGGTAEVELTITSPAQQDGMGPIFGGYVRFTTGSGEAEDTYSVAYGGYAHDLQQVEVMMDMSDGTELPAMGVFTACDIWLGWECHDETGTIGLVPPGYVYTMDAGNHPQVLIHFEHQARRMEFEVYKANTDGSKGASLGVVRATDYLARSETRDGISAFPWDGMYVDENGARQRVADGEYMIEVRVTKASAWNDDRAADVETWTSPVFGIDWTGEGLVDRPVVGRVLGQTRYSTAAEVAVENFEPGVDTVYVASGQTYPDALTGGALAGSEEVPVLLTRKDYIPAATRMALEDLRPDRVVILGGAGAVNAAVQTQLGDYSADVRRVEGPDRYATAAAVSAQFAASDLVFLASGQDYPDALAAAAAGGMEDAPVLLVKQNALPLATAAELERHSPATIVVAGGPGAVSEAVVEAAGEFGDVVVMDGEDRYDTAAMLAEEFFPTPAPGAYVTTGWQFPDALAAAPVAAMNNQPVLLTKADALPSTTMAALTELKAQTITLMGGYRAISLEVQEALEEVVYP